MILSKYIRRARDVSRALLLGRREKNEFKPGRVYYSQCGEDAILRFIFTALKIPNPTYLEIGAYHPIELSNTYLFYCQGSAGLCVEPNPQLIEAFTRIRPRDICVQAGCGGVSKGNVKFYVFDPAYLSTFSAEEAERYSRYPDHRIERVIGVPVFNVNELIVSTLKREPDFVSVDVEGLDMEIVKSFDFSRFRPVAFCVETISYTADGTEAKIPEIGIAFAEQGYMLYADTYVNSIFVDEKEWRSKHRPKPN